MPEACTITHRTPALGVKFRYQLVHSFQSGRWLLQSSRSQQQLASRSRSIGKAGMASNYVFKPTAEQVACIIHTLSRGGGLTRR